MAGIKDEPNPKDKPEQGDTHSYKSAFGKLPNEISEEDLSHKGVQRLLLNELQRLQEEITELEGYKDKFHAVDKEKSILQEKFIKNKIVDFMSKFCIGMGGVCLSLGAKIYDNIKPDANNSISWILIVTGAVLIVGSLILSSKR